VGLAGNQDVREDQNFLVREEERTEERKEPEIS
jgi:hypothetical protein